MKAALAELRAIIRMAHEWPREDALERWIQEWVVELNGVAAIDSMTMAVVGDPARFIQHTTDDLLRKLGIEAATNCSRFEHTELLDMHELRAQLTLLRPTKKEGT